MFLEGLFYQYRFLPRIAFNYLGAQEFDSFFLIYLLPISAKNTQEYFNEEFNTSRNFILIDILFN